MRAVSEAAGDAKLTCESIRREATVESQSSGEPAPSEAWDRDAGTRALDELFTLAGKYRSAKSYGELMRFVSRFCFYAPFNAMLVHVQIPGATYVAPANRWGGWYGRRIRPGARPLVILQPMGPVMFVFDVSDTEPGPDAPPLPREVTHPFEVRRGFVGTELPRTIANAMRDGVFVADRDAGSQSAGEIELLRSPGAPLWFQIRERPAGEYVEVPRRYQVLLNAKHSSEARYATLVHELAHLYCGHLGSPNPRWWPDRRGLAHDVAEFEAESVSYLVCQRLGIDSPSAEYLGQVLQEKSRPPAISLDCVLKAAGLIEQMGRERLKPRKEKHS
jgi:hypothetical protein